VFKNDRPSRVYSCQKFIDNNREYSIDKSQKDYAEKETKRFKKTAPIIAMK
jgi:hypothetical protein